MHFRVEELFILLFNTFLLIESARVGNQVNIPVFILNIHGDLKERAEEIIKWVLIRALV
jgi:hypothetical protein